MYEKNGVQLSAYDVEFNAKISGISPSEWAAQNGFTLVEEGKTTVPEETTPPTEPVKTTAAGDSSLADTSLESPGIDEFAKRVANNVKSGDDSVIPVYIPQEDRIIGVSDPYMGQVTVQTDNGEIAYYDAGAAPKVSTKDDVYGTSDLGVSPISTSQDIIFETEKRPIQENPKLANVQDYNPELKTDFVSKHYDVIGLQAVDIEVADFEAWLKRKGFFEDFEKDLADGVYTSKWYDGTTLGLDFTKQEALDAQKEATLYRFLQDYINDTQGELDKKNAINDYSLNKDYYSEAVGYKGMLDLYYDKSIKEQSLEPLYDYDQLSIYNQNYFPALSKRNKKIQEKLQSEVKKEKERGAISSFDNAAGQTIESTIEGFFDAGFDFIYWMEDGILGALGASDSYVDRQRLYSQEIDAWDVKNLNYMSAKGKKVTHKGSNYIVSEEGTIYDVDAGYIVNNVLSEGDSKNILLNAKASEEIVSDVSVKGGAVQMGAVMGNIGFQVLATRGLGRFRAAASSAYLAKANGFKNVAQYNKYMNMVNRGGTNMRGITNASTFGLRVPFNPAIAESTLFQTFYGAASGYEQTILAAKNAGLTNKEAEDLASQAMLEMGALYGLTGPINPRIAAMKNLDDFLSRSGVVNKAVRDYLKAGKSPLAFKESLKASLVKTATVSKNFLSEGSKEVVQENIQQYGEFELVNKRLNEAAGVDFLKDTYSRKDFIETSILSFVSAGLLGSVNLKNVGFKGTNKQRITNLYAFAKDMKGSTSRLNAMVDAGRITRDQADEIIFEAGVVASSINSMPARLLEQDAYDAVEILKLQSSIKEMEAQKKRMDKAYHSVIDQSILTAQSQLEELIIGANREIVLKDAEIAGRLARKAGSNVKALTNEDFIKAGYDASALNADGFMEQDGEIIINIDRAAETEAFSVASHELLHNILRNEFKNVLSKEQQKTIINEFREILKKRGILADIDKRAKILNPETGEQVYDIKFDKEGNVEGADIDEYITFLSDAIAKEEVSFEQLGETVWARIGRWISNAVKTSFGRKDIKFENGRQVFDFVKDYQSSYKKGKLSFAAKAKAKASKGVTTDTKLSVTTKKELFETIRSVVPKKAKTKSEFQSDPGFTDIYMLLQPGQPVHNFIVSKFPGQTEKVRGLIESLEERLINFDPEKKRKGSNEAIGTEGFVEFLMANINFAALDINKKLAKEAAIEKQTGSLDSETAKQVADISNEIKKELAKRPEYKDLLRRRVVDEDVIKDIEQKVTKIVALLKSRIDAKVSNNVTVTPLIREIKKEAGKSIDIDFKKAMGGKKDGELRKFLLRNKAAILENMSTTWLSQAIPNAIQKSVDGVFTTDWKGKKIDRETMETDLAGRTSGADLVRRLPKAPGAISDSDFLSAFLEPNGNPTRGKKESLAKAMAEEITFDIIKKSFDENGPIAKAFIENQKRNGVENAENMGPEFKRQAERGNVKFSFTEPISEGRPPAVRVLNEADIMATLQLLDSAAGDSRVLKEELIQTALTKILKDNGYGNKLFDLSDPKQLETYTQAIKEFVVPIMERDFWGTEKATHLLHSKEVMFGSQAGKKSEFEAARNKLIEDIFNDPNQKYGKKIRKPKKFVNPETINAVKTTPQNVLQNENIAQAAYKQGAVLDYNLVAEQTGKQLWFGIKKILEENKDNPNVAMAIATWLSSSASNTNHPMRNLATMIGYSKGFDKKVSPIEIEHALPATTMIQTLFNTALQNPEDFATNYSYVMNNYVLIGMNKSDENKTKAFRQTNIEGYNLRSGTWWDRYLNPITAKIQGYLKGKDGKKQLIDDDFGINPRSIILFSGNSLYEVAGVRKNGSFLADFEIGAQKIKLKKGKKYFKLKDIAKVAAKDKVELDKFQDGQRKYSVSFPEPSILNAQFNAMLSRKSGIDGATEISRARGQILGKNKGRFKFFIAPGADDFRGLVHYAFAGQGKQGEKDMKFFEKNLMDPYFRGIAAIDAMRQLIKREFKVVTKEFKDEYKMLEESVPGTPFTYDHALRVYMWSLAGIEVPGLDKRDLNTLENAILDNPALADFAEALLIVGRRETWPKPSEFWLGDSVLADLNSMTEKVGRKDILAQFITNVDAMFDEATLNKIEAIKGRKHREALEDSIYAMKNGSNRPSGANIQTNKWLNWINGSTASIMFVNRRSALLQMLSFTNFINWSDNNPIKAAAAFADQKQYWKDFVFLFNSDKLKERRGGLKQDISESEIAQVAGRSKNSPQAVLARILKAGFLPTQIADSFAIATGGATFYRNRINTYLKQGMSQKKAEEKAFEDFSKASDVAQQSSDPALVSQEQRSILGRLILAFANTPMQYTRLMKKAGQDLINGRGDAKAHISKILYYGAVQNFIFSALQSALFALFFDDDEEDDEKRKRNADQKLLRTVNSMVDTILRGSGIYGAVVSTIKNTIQTYYAQQDKKFMADHTYTVLSALNISPPIGSKFRKLYAAIQTAKFEKDAIAARGWALTANGKLNLGPNWAILGALTSGIGNVPIDRIEAEISSIAEALDARNKAWQRIALALGWKTWDVGAKNEEEDLIETLAKEKRKEEGKKKATDTRRKNKIKNRFKKK